MFADSIKRLGRRTAERIAGLLASTGITPNWLTTIGFVLNIAVGVVLALGYIRIGGVLVLVFGTFDMLDGALARISGKASTFGAFLDSTLDRYSEAVVLFGLLFWYGQQGNLTVVLLAYATIVGSVMVSYTRARAEGLGLQCEVGLLARPERIALLGIGLILDQALIVLAILALFTNVTALQRVIHVWKLTSGKAE
ncbi:MAG: CDP-alcohol phosphatidyltransferase family protein [Chloroflexi bacterium]|nr:CDP-alcohol phosphatidyltransferase family protein [Chloroflexota bacterium]MDA8189530.1 CDP-alcohol phosphatidyltransferase family protein [Dehalococcoidales bacterium]